MLYNGPPDKDSTSERAGYGCLIRLRGIRLTDPYKCLAFDISYVRSDHSNISIYEKL